MNTAIFTRSGFNSGIGFAIPVDTVKRIVPQLIANGRVSLPSLNAQIASPKVAQSLEVGTSMCTLCASHARVTLADHPSANPSSENVPVAGTNRGRGERIYP